MFIPVCPLKFHVIISHCRKKIGINLRKKNDGLMFPWNVHFIFHFFSLEFFCAIQDISYVRPKRKKAKWVYFGHRSQKISAYFGRGGKKRKVPRLAGAE